MMTNEKRLIDQDGFQALLNQQIEFGAPDLIAAVYAALHDSQVVDAVEVVRCRDCEHWDGLVCGVHSEWPDQYSTGHMDYTEPDDFCSYGERRADNNA